MWISQRVARLGMFYTIHRNENNRATLLRIGVLVRKAPFYGFCLVSSLYVVPSYRS